MNVAIIGFNESGKLLERIERKRIIIRLNVRHDSADTNTKAKATMPWSDCMWSSSDDEAPKGGRMSSRSGSRGNYLCTVDWSTNPLPLSHANGILRRGKSLKGFCGQTLKGLGKLGHASLWRRHSRSQIFMSHSRSHSPPPLTSLQCCDDYENVRAVSASSSSIPDAIKRRRDEDEEEKLSQQNASHKI
jgi:hypothetical protein